MKIAVTGAHQTGKTTLVNELGLSLPGYRVMQEPYCQLLEKGYEFPGMPGIEDFELQLKYSLRQTGKIEGNTIFDRCPVDFLAYLQAHEEAAELDAERWRPEVENALAELDLLVFVPIENPDILPAGHLEYAGLRSRVDEMLRDLIPDFDCPVLEVTGTLSGRLQQVLARIENR